MNWASFRAGVAGVLRESVRQLGLLGDRIARLTRGQFFFLCLLMLIASGIAGDLLSESEPPRVRSTVPHKPSSDAPSQTKKPVSETSPEKAPIEISIGNGRIVVRDGEDSEAEAETTEGRRGKDKPAAYEPPLVTLTVLLIILLFILRLFAGARLRAAERLALAEGLAERESLSRQLAEARLAAMQAQVEPHFLFNTLGAVEFLIETDPPRAAKMQRHLIAYLRAVLPNLRRSDSTLEQEVDACRNYLEILKVRMEHRLEFSFGFPEGLGSASFPPLMLQSVVENAIHHGLEPKASGGRVDLSVHIRHGALVVEVADTGVGLRHAPRDPMATLGGGKESAGGLGLSNLRERLQTLYGPKGKLILEDNEPSGARIRIEIPYQVASRHDA